MNDVTLFTAGGRFFSIGDALGFAIPQGLLKPVLEEIGEGLACRQYALELGFELEAGQPQDAVEAWRQAHELTSAQETLAWLSNFGLSVEDLSDHFETRLWRARFFNERRQILSEYPPVRENVERQIKAALLISWRLKELARNLAWRVAALLECQGSIPERPLRDLLPDLVASFEHVRTRMVTEENCREEIASSRFSLVQVECEGALFESRNEAQEAVFCVQQDGEELETVCARAHVPLQRGRYFSDDLPTEIRDRYLSASSGEIFLMPQSEGGFQVMRLLRKIEPDIADDAVRQRVESRLLLSSFSQLEARHVQWTD